VQYRPPEEWELNIISIERGEWSEHMSEEAFRKYKKERPKLKDCAFLVEEEDVPNNSKRYINIFFKQILLQDFLLRLPYRSGPNVFFFLNF